MRALEWLLGLLVVIAAVVTRGPRRQLPAGVDPEDVAVGYERSDASVGWILAGGTLLLVSVLVVVVVVTTFGVANTGLPVTLGRPTDLVNRLTPAPTPPPPRLETAEGQDYTAYRASAEHQLTTYGWVDRQAGVVNIPIDRAMDLVAERGLPARASQSGSTEPQTVAPSGASSGRVDERVWP